MTGTVAHMLQGVEVRDLYVTALLLAHCDPTALTSNNPDIQAHRCLGLALTAGSFLTPDSSSLSLPVL